MFFNLLLEAEPFAAILIAQGTHGVRSQEFVNAVGALGENLRPKAESRQGVLGKCILDALRAQKTYLVAMINYNIAPVLSDLVPGGFRRSLILY